MTAFTTLTDSAALRHALLADRPRVLTQLYARAYPQVRRHVQRRGGSEADAQDVFHDALVVFYEQAVGGTLTLTAAPSTYLLAVSRNLWRRELQRRQRLPTTDEAASELSVAPEAAEPALSVRDFVEQLGAKCRDILVSFYYFQQPLEQIAAAHKFRTVRSATVQKFKCLERLRHAVRHLREELLPA